MIQQLLHPTLRIASLAAVIVSVGAGPAVSQGLSESEIVGKLAPKTQKTRSLSRSLSSGSGEGMSQQDKAFINRVTSRGIKFDLATKDKVYDIVETYELPKLDFEINFEFGSKEISLDSVPQLVELSKALNHPGLAGSKVLLVGHTDAKGSDAFNQGLSEQRANSVLIFLVQVGEVDVARLVAFGYGETRLKSVQDPYASENRRVEIVNLTN